MIKFHHVLLAGAVLALSTVSSQAALVGSLGVNGQNVTQNGASPDVSTVFTTSGTTPTSGNSGIFAGVTDLTTMFGPTSVNLANASTGFGFSLSNAAWGNFVATKGSIIFQGAGNALLAVTGTYTSGTSIPGGAGQKESFSALITYTQVAGGGLTQNISISVPMVPEPSSVALGAIGLVSLSLVALRKRRSSN